MEQVIDRVIVEVKALTELPASEGGIADILPLKAVYFGDPGIMPVSLYPNVCVGPSDDDDSEGGETTGSDQRTLSIDIILNLDARDYFDTDEEEASGDRALVQAASAIGRWFRRRDKRQLDGLAGVRDVTVAGTQYRPMQRGQVITKSSRTTLHVTKNYLRE